MQEEIKEILQKFNEKVKNVELIRNPYSSEDKKIKKILIYLEEDHCDIFKNILDCITNLQEENEKLNNIIDEKDYKIKRIVYSCYESDMSYDEFKRIWVNVFGKLYDPKDIDKLENELKGDNK